MTTKEEESATATLSSDDNKIKNDDDVAKHECLLPLRMTSTVVKGFGRGSKELGIPTANLDREKGKYRLMGSSSRSSGDDDSSSTATTEFDDLPTGIYWGFCRIGGTSETIYKTACSIGYNPYYGNNIKTVEPHLIAQSTDTTHRHASKCGESLLGDFYDQQIRLSLVGYLRPELPFEGIDKLIAAIKQDIVDTERLSLGDSTIIQQEKEWIASNNDPM